VSNNGRLEIAGAATAVTAVEIGFSVAEKAAQSATPDATIDQVGEIIVTGERPTRGGILDSIRNCFGMCDGVKD
jgi:hypothetical protein